MEFLQNPNIAYLFLVSALLLAILGLFTPGTGFIEIGAIFCLLLAGYGIYTIPINAWALGVLILGVFPFLLALRRSGNRIYLVISLVALTIGSTFLFRSASNWVPAVNPFLALVVSVGVTLFLWVAIRKVLDAMRRRTNHDLHRLVGVTGRTRTPVADSGTVYAGGEDWSAHSVKPIPANTWVKVVSREGFILEVEPLNDTGDLKNP